MRSLIRARLGPRSGSDGLQALHQVVANPQWRAEPITLREVTVPPAAAQSGPDGIAVVMPRHDGALVLRALHQLLTAVWAAERVPEAWLLALYRKLDEKELPGDELAVFRRRRGCCVDHVYAC